MPRPTKKAALAAATKAPNHHVQLMPDQISSLINSVIEFPPLPSPATPKPSPSKRKTAMVISDGDSSDIEIIEGPRPSPKKKARGITPGTNVSNDPPAFSLPDMIEETIRTSSLAFTSSGRPSRVKAKTEKGALLEELKVSRKIRGKVAAGNSAPSDTAAGEAESRPPPPPVPSSPVQLTAPNNTPLKGAQAARASRTKQPEAKSDDVEMSSPVTKEAEYRQAMKPKAPSDSPLDAPHTIKDIRPKRITKAKPLVNEGEPDVFKVPSPRPKFTLKKRAAKTGAQPIGAMSDIGNPSEEDLPEVSDLFLSTPKKEKVVLEPEFERVPRSAALAGMLDVEALENDTDSGMSDQGSNRYLATDDDGSVGYQTDDAPEPEELSVHEGDGPALTDEEDTIAASAQNKEIEDADDLTVVTSPRFQDPALSEIYKNLPFLEKFRPIVPYTEASDQKSDPKKATSARYLFSKIAPTLNQSEADSLLRAMYFTQSGFYVNFSRIHPKFLQNENGRIRMARSDNAMAVGIYTGLCTRGAIIDVEAIGPPKSRYDVHGVSVAGSDQETRRYMTLINLVLGHQQITGNASRLGLSFYTRTQGRDGNFGPSTSYHSTPPLTKMSPLISSVAMPGSSVSFRSFPASRSFDDRIPVYDGRASSGRKFNFSDEDFQNLASWPLYHGRGEIEMDTVISVGHTVGTYREGRYLSTNIHFVIILGKPAIGL